MPDIPACCPTPQRLSLAARSLRPMSGACARRPNDCALRRNRCARRPNHCALRRNRCARRHNDCAPYRRAMPCGPVVAPYARNLAPVSARSAPCGGRSAFRSLSTGNPRLSLKANKLSTDVMMGPDVGASKLALTGKASFIFTIVSSRQYNLSICQI